MNPLTELRYQLARALCDLEALEIPTWNYDGTEVKTAEQVAAILGIPLTEAEVRLEAKDVYSASATHAVGMGVGTRIHGERTVEREHRKARKRRRRKRRPSKREEQAA